MARSTGSETLRAGAWTIVAVAVLAASSALVRAEGLIAPGGGSATAQFDEGVYVGAAGALVEGDLPYRDHVFLHPPGIFVLLGPVAATVEPLSSWSGVLLVARWLVVLVAAGNVVLVALNGVRWRGWLAGVVAGALYACYLPAVRTEGHVMLEPFVNFFVLAGALIWCGRARRSGSDARAAWAGSLIGFGMTVKLTGGLALIALLVSDRRRGPRRHRTTTLVAASVVVAAGSGLEERPARTTPSATAASPPAAIGTTQEVLVDR